MSIRIYVEGERALWTRPENKAERVSYPAMTFSSARNCLQAIYWKPSIEWVVESIEVLRPSRFISVKRNEVKSLAIKGKDDFYIEELRTQRYTLMLAGIKQEDAPQERPKLAYIINAHFRMTDLAGVSRKKWQEHTPEELANDANPDKHLAIIMERLQNGSAFTQPYFGTRECTAYFRLANDADVCLLSEEEKNKDWGWMFYDFDFSDKKNPRPLFFHAKLKEGTIYAPKKEALSL
ncbi:type I-C CRISPR-associated protein Cas5c [Entomospira culicis]|uniref:pre-crRNA processing endonuclease n=1 Tax=Entomospira culicis TaxID=2719989 RepID=A0A968GF53_9SPIO|nr:type I-C CRISPR-associated protein Cas5c [Entomospira culicis]NIZ18917.1 type I-C CRISPR-associated protein Cas5 [Entomospira culicis]NIZ69132.1 type I-C CRISPR-associated protein Cas5 [Entomospira culicis]WDI37718.1 type I-C CRISPR-associated protein Cas5c [Entomospira culicis]WDI39346.1 type I-C CRISPR-associated protein Cas5c [Entomospira culicis]